MASFRGCMEWKNTERGWCVPLSALTPAPVRTKARSTGEMEIMDEVYARSARLPTHVWLVPHDFLATDPEKSPVPKEDKRVRVVRLLDHADAAPEDRDPVAGLDGSVLFVAGVPFLAPAHQEGQPGTVDARVLAPEGDAFSVVSDEDVAAVRGQRF